MSAATMREQAAVTATDLFLADERVAIVLGEISTPYFERAFAHDPRRAINVGIMEQTMVGVAAGYAMEGFRTIVHTITPFLVERPLEQWKLDFGYQRLGGTLISTGASYDYATEGATHQAPGDVQAISTIPGAQIFAPGHPDEMDVLLRAVYADDRLSYLRASVSSNGRAHGAAPGRTEVLRRGAGPVILAIGPMLDRAGAAAAELGATLLYTASVEPFDGSTLADVVADGDLVVVIEPFYEGTTARQVTEALRTRNARTAFIGVPRRFLEHYGTPAEHEAELGLDEAGIRGRLELLA